MLLTLISSCIRASPQPDDLKRAQLALAARHELQAQYIMARISLEDVAGADETDKTRKMVFLKLAGKEAVGTLRSEIPVWWVMEVRVLVLVPGWARG